jgi:threonine/homoserine efflux transporter RhtA
MEAIITLSLIALVAKNLKGIWTTLQTGSKAEQRQALELVAALVNTVLFAGYFMAAQWVGLSGITATGIATLGLCLVCVRTRQTA